MKAKYSFRGHFAYFFLAVCFSHFFSSSAALASNDYRTTSFESCEDTLTRISLVTSFNKDVQREWANKSEKSITGYIGSTERIVLVKSQILDDGRIFIISPQTKEFIGWVSYDINGDHARMNILLNESVHGQGIGPHTISFLIEKIFSENSNVLRIDNHVNDDNKASVRMHEKLGFVRIEGTSSMVATRQSFIMNH